MTNFKNYEYESLDCSPGLNCLVGMNGMGKTNMLDAIYYLCMGKSYFGLPDQHLVRHDSDFFRLEGVFQKEGKREKIVAKVIPRKKKDLERNDVPYARLSDHVGLLPVVIIVPDDTQIATEGSEIRRRFLDNTLSQLDDTYLRHLIRYTQVLKQRNAALKQMAERGRFEASLLEVYNHQMAEPAKTIFQKRKDFVSAFNPALERSHHIISGERELAACRFRSQLEEEDLPALLEKNLEKDQLLERTTAGIHRDDLVFTLDGQALKRFASQGQLKSFVLALKLAQYDFLAAQKKERPILLLDDIFDKLDRSRVEHLLQLLLNEGYGQTFITDTDEDRVVKLAGAANGAFSQFRIQNGAAQAL